MPHLAKWVAGKVEERLLAHVFHRWGPCLSHPWVSTIEFRSSAVEPYGAISQFFLNGGGDGTQFGFRKNLSAFTGQKPAKALEFQARSVTMFRFHSAERPLLRKTRSRGPPAQRVRSRWGLRLKCQSTNPACSLGLWWHRSGWRLRNKCQALTMGIAFGALWMWDTGAAPVVVPSLTTSCPLQRLNR